MSASKDLSSASTNSVSGHNPSLSEEWETDYDEETGKAFFINHTSQTIQWHNPRDKYTKPATVADCIDDELPFGWEEAYAPNVGKYYIDHINRKNQLEDPREECRNMQMQMLQSYLNQAESHVSSSSLAIVNQSKDQSLERLNSSLLQLEISGQVTPGQTGLPDHPHHHHPHPPHQHEQKQSSPAGRPVVRDREGLQQSLQDSKSRVARLKRELDTNARLLTLIDRYKTRDEEFAVEV